jgi:N-acetylglucosamine-6-phosphate deacetylase
MDRAFANWRSLGLAPLEAVRRTSTIAADYLGLADRGRIVAGARADLVALAPDGSVEAVWRDGRRL